MLFHAFATGRQRDEWRTDNAQHRTDGNNVPFSLRPHDWQDRSRHIQRPKKLTSIWARTCSGVSVSK